MVETWHGFYGPNQGYVEELYERYLADPNSVDADTRSYFAELSRGQLAPVPVELETRTQIANGFHPAPVLATTDVTKVVGAARLARCIREYGHLAADIDPLGAPRPGDPMLNPVTHGITDQDLAALPGTIVWPQAGPAAGNCLEAIATLREIYSGPIGYEFDHVQDFEERTWLHQQVEAGTFSTPLAPDDKRALLRRLSEVENFEHYLHTVYVGQKRFSIEGEDTLVPMLDELITDTIADGAREILIGMAHRGRLNVLAHIMGRPYAKIFSQFHSNTGEPAHHTEPADGATGDVKYHLGAQRALSSPNGEVRITLANNPSHLGFVNAVTEGETRAAQDDRSHPGAPTQDVHRAVAVALHGDAAFPGEGIVAETLNLSGLPGYNAGGTILIIVNNQVGFTTSPEAGRSTLYASDVAKGYEIPIVHVNADHPEACLTVMRLALAYRRRFYKDFLIDLVGYRRWGHNEGDEPAFTQPRMYAQISRHPTVRSLYADSLIEQGIITPDDVKTMQTETQQRLQQAREDMGAVQTETVSSQTRARWDTVPPAVSIDTLQQMNEELLRVPEDFSSNPKLRRILNRRRDVLGGHGGIDWAQAEALAFASILAGGIPIRLTGQDAERGTFSQRHLVLHDPDTGQKYIPLQNLPEAKASFAVYNSPLSETAVLAFEYGYTVHAPDALVLWEAQFGDFANVAQVVIDQFLSASRAKWREQPGLVMLLPHGYEGQGPEHSSGRLERFLQLAAEDNVRVANCTTSAQYFHLLRLQAANLSGDRRPLILMTPKSLLRHPRAASSLEDLSSGSFHPVLNDPEALRHPDTIERLVLSSGKVSIDLAEGIAKQAEPIDWLATARVELLYPFPKDELEAVVSAYPNLREVIWLQEEPANMGAWVYIASRLQPLLPAGVALQYMGRPERASTAEGTAEWHEDEQQRIVKAAIGAGRATPAAAGGMKNVG